VLILCIFFKCDKNTLDLFGLLSHCFST